jgi:hypothetical protein
MSQHVFFTDYKGERTYILMGWDREMQGFFMVIDMPDRDNDEPYWSNLYHTPPFTQNLIDFLTVLKEKNIILPHEMLLEVTDDQRFNRGNKEVTHRLTNGVYQRSDGISDAL